MERLLLLDIIISKPVVAEIIPNVQGNPLSTKEMLPKFLRNSRKNWNWNY